VQRQPEPCEEHRQPAACVGGRGGGAVRSAQQEGGVQGGGGIQDGAGLRWLHMHWVEVRRKVSRGFKRAPWTPFISRAPGEDSPAMAKPLASDRSCTARV
jgi:hypothetical protein